MQKVQKCHSDNFKHSHAFDDYGNCVPLGESINDGRCYYFDRGKQIKLILKKSIKENQFWSAFPKQIYRDKDGKEYAFKDLENKMSESPEHLEFKRNIIYRGFFFHKRLKVYIQNAIEEGTIINSRYEADITAQLLDGTDCIIEVIKTSDLSEKKQIYIEQNQILTFKIYIDKHGNQEHQRDRILGNREIEEITQSIQKGEGQLAELCETGESERRRIKKQTFNRVEEHRSRIDAKSEDLRRKIESFKEPTHREIDEAERRNGDIESVIARYSREIERYNDEIKNYQSKPERDRSDNQAIQEHDKIKESITWLGAN